MDDKRRTATAADTSGDDPESVRRALLVWHEDRSPDEPIDAEDMGRAEDDGLAELDEAEADEPRVGIVGQIHNVAGPVADAIGSVIVAASQGMSVRQASVERRLHRMARQPLANLFEVYPEARLAVPRELGMRFVPVEDIAGTAVAGAAQRGGDFLPLKPFRGQNWEGRWRRLREANDKLQPLPPVDLMKYEGEYWVVDGHNRVAVTLYANGVGLDAMVTELVALDGQTSELPRNVLSYLGETGEMRAAAQGHRPAMGMRQVEQQSGDEAAVVYETELEAPLPDEPEPQADEKPKPGPIPSKPWYWD
jgi:hypothetical protein